MATFIVYRMTYPDKKTSYVTTSDGGYTLLGGTLGVFPQNEEQIPTTLSSYFKALRADQDLELEVSDLRFEINYHKASPLTAIAQVEYVDREKTFEVLINVFENTTARDRRFLGKEKRIVRA